MALSDVRDFSKNSKRERRISIATGVSAYPFVTALADKLETICPNLKINVYKIINNFFGETITVSGLLTGRDMLSQLKDKELGEELLIPENSLRDGEDVFLCGMTVSELSSELGVRVTPAGSDGYELVEAILSEKL
jgi:NifB/MoaA-like Fe-S oxidoreductase